MSITDELRECIRTANRSYEDARNPYNDREILHIPEEELLAIADRIDAEHAAKVERLEKYRAAVDAMLKEYVKLPVDADGVPIHVGDELEHLGEVITMELERFGTWQLGCSNGSGNFDADELRHVKPDSWERIIHDAFMESQEHFGSADAVAELVERCRRLAGERG